MNWNINAPLPEVRPAWLRIIISLMIILPLFPMYTLIGLLNRFSLNEIFDLYWNKLLIPCLYGEDDDDME
jgi:hypothetical protein